MKKKNDAQLARDQGISRQAINDRRNKGWSEEEIQAGERSTPRKPRYTTKISEILGRPVVEIAQELKIPPAQVYRRYHKAARGGGKVKIADLCEN